MNEKNIGNQFVDDMYEILAYNCKKILEDDLSYPNDELYTYQELFEYFEIVTNIILATRRLLDVYDDLSPDLVGFAITKNINDFDIEFSLDNETLKDLQEKIQEQITKNKE